MGGKGVPGTPFPIEEIKQVIAEIYEENSCLSLRDLAVDGHDLMNLGLSGKDIGSSLNMLLSKVLDEELPNEKSALLAEVRRML